MSKNTVSSTSNENHKNTTMVGTMPSSQLKRFGMQKNFAATPYDDEDSFRKEFNSQAKRRWIKKSTERVVAYRMLSGQCATETKLPAPMRQAVRYFSRTMTGSGGGATRRDARPEQTPEQATE